MLSRRSLLLSSAALIGCRKPKATGYSGYCFVADQDGHSLSVVDLTTFRRWRPVPLDAAPSQLLPHPRLPQVFALAAQEGVVYRIDVASLAVVRRARAGTHAVSMRLSTEGDALWVLYRDPASLVELTLDTLEPRRHIPLPGAPDDFDLSPDHRAAVASSALGAVVIASLDRAAIERAVALEAQPAIVRFQQKGAQIVAGCPSDRSLIMVDVAGGRVIVRLPVPIQPRHFCFSSDEGQLFVTGEGKDAVVIAYPYQTEIGETILAGRAPAGMAIAGPAAQPYLLVANPDTNTVTVLDINYRKLAAVVQVGQEPREILITPDNQYALVLNQKSGDLAVIRIAALAARRYKSAPLFNLIPVGQKPVSAAVVALT
ncbi:MAG TPA: beta-propeller fold lactonase family protein [Bryobacteraceae bacterium]|nr:beta-propeller fold lactonase family protein [Bryobacteraceae bacterium]